MGAGPRLFVDAAKGDDHNAGTQQAPWKTINHALTQLSPGETLYLREGVYFENVRCAVAGEPDQPITLRAYPGEQAVIDASLREFQESPAACWEPVPDGAPSECRSVKTYKNIRDVVGLFGDSLVGLQTYWYREDLCAENELWKRDTEKKLNPLPVYCGPGLWYDKRSGRIHARLAHTSIQNDRVRNYRGETDPRKLPLVVAPFSATALFVDQAMHVRYQDLILRGGGHDTVVLHNGIDLEFDNVTIYAGTYGMRARGTGPMKFTNSAIHGMIPPWAFRVENSLRGAGPGHSTPFLVAEGQDPSRNVARLNTHAVLVTEGSYEFEVFYYPHNHDWEVSHSEFTDGHDGVYLSGHNIRFHHNHVHGFQDDAIYLSAPSPYFNDNIHVYQNLIRHVGMSFGMHTRGGPAGSIFIYRNVCDQRERVNWSRPTEELPSGDLMSNLPLVVHGRQFLGGESVYFYHNLFISPNRGGTLAFGLAARNSAATSRWLLNNILVYLPTPGREYPFRGWGHALESDVQIDGNLHWCPDPAADGPGDFLEQCRATDRGAFTNRYPYAWEQHGQIAAPGFAAFRAEPGAANDYRLRQDSPAVGAGVALPEVLPDEFRPTGDTRPDIGPLPLGAEDLRVGRGGRVSAVQFRE